MSRRAWTGLLAALGGCYSPYVLPSVGFDQTAALLPARGAEVAAGGGYQLETQAAPNSTRSGEELLTGSLLGSLGLSGVTNLLLSAGPGSGEAALKIRLPVQAFDLAVQPEAGAAGYWTWQTNQSLVQGGPGSLSGGADVLASGALGGGVTIYGGLRALGVISGTGAFVGGAGLGVECHWGPVLLRPELAVSQTFGFDGSTQFIAYPHLTLAVRP